MTIQKIIFLVGQYFTERDHARFGIELLQENGFEVSVWDLSSFIYPETTGLLKSIFGVIEQENIIRFDSIKEVLRAIGKENHQTFFMSTIYYTLQSMKIFKAISQAGCKYGCTGPYTKGIFPRSDNMLTYENVLEKILDKKIIQKMINIVYQIYLKISLRLYGINYANYFALAGGRLTTAVGPIISNNTYIQHIHAADYDSLLKHNTSNGIKHDNDIIVFIDQNLPNAADALIFTPAAIESKQYYEDLRIFFQQIETVTGDKIVIAAHPKANYKGKEYLFGHREIIHGFNSTELISKSKLVLMHYSMAISIAVLYRKPILFLTSTMLDKSSVAVYIYHLANYFKVLPININDERKQIELPAVDNELYDSYIYNYIKKPGTKDILFWQQVADYIKEYN